MPARRGGGCLVRAHILGLEGGSEILTRSGQDAEGRTTRIRRRKIPGSSPEHGVDVELFPPMIDVSPKMGERSPQVKTYSPPLMVEIPYRTAPPSWPVLLNYSAHISISTPTAPCANLEVLVACHLLLSLCRHWHLVHGETATVEADPRPFVPRWWRSIRRTRRPAEVNPGKQEYSYRHTCSYPILSGQQPGQSTDMLRLLSCLLSHTLSWSWLSNCLRSFASFHVIRRKISVWLSPSIPINHLKKINRLGTARCLLIYFLLYLLPSVSWSRQSQLCKGRSISGIVSDRE